METPSSSRRVTRSQTMASGNGNSNLPFSRKIEESEKGVSKSRQRSAKQQDRSALIDITNDSPIVGLAMGSLKTPSSSTISKKRINGFAKQSTPGSGEALLRGQVKTLLQKVEEEAEISKLCFENRPFLHFVNSPVGLLAPTPANTPHVLNLSDCSEESFKNICLASVTPSPVQEQIDISQMVADLFDGKKEESVEFGKDLITRSLLLDFSDKPEGSESSDCSSVLTYKGGESGGSNNIDDDSSSVWSIQVNASTRDEEEDENVEEEVGEEDDDENNYEDDDYEEEEEEENGDVVDELCEGIKKIDVNGGEKRMPKFAGKHTKFVYNSDGEIVGEEECDEEGEVNSCYSLGVLCLKGLPTPKGKHLRFPEDLEEEED